MKKPLIVANWKLYVTSKEAAITKARSIARGASRVNANLVICPPTPYIEAVARAVGGKGVAVGAQTASSLGDEKRTGEVPPVMLSDIGATYVLVGHSERRAQGESGEQLRAIVEATLKSKLSPILCIGEKERDASGEHYEELRTQLREVLVKIAPKDAKRLVIAYEPVWAIGKSADDAMDAHALEETVIYIKKVLAELIGRTAALSTPILYGGSVEASNASTLIGAGVSGFLVGHASVEPKSLLSIAQYASSKH